MNCVTVKETLRRLWPVWIQISLQSLERCLLKSGFLMLYSPWYKSSPVISLPQLERMMIRNIQGYTMIFCIDDVRL
ncbi:hypothetical protein DPMN_148414 [Dreissena polymorpha]|uniref:Uncharacterized protein n=1 Tax=Dreissena polymorpha TaxID=45954 RepID=A0A9D4FE15_DREPO|nr:hypothetical protein DPMN_148414 [Dreissena polymorpha]